MVIEEIARSMRPELVAAKSAWNPIGESRRWCRGAWPTSLTRSTSKPSNSPLVVLELPWRVGRIGADRSSLSAAKAGTAKLAPKTETPTTWRSCETSRTLQPPRSLAPTVQAPLAPGPRGQEIHPIAPAMRSSALPRAGQVPHTHMRRNLAEDVAEHGAGRQPDARRLENAQAGRAGIGLAAQREEHVHAAARLVGQDEGRVAPQPS